VPGLGLGLGLGLMLGLGVSIRVRVRVLEFGLEFGCRVVGGFCSGFGVRGRGRGWGGWGGGLVRVIE
jgi:hypothetical protein